MRKAGKYLLMVLLLAAVVNIPYGIRIEDRQVTIVRLRPVEACADPTSDPCP